MSKGSLTLLFKGVERKKEKLVLRFLVTIVEELSQVDNWCISKLF